MLLGQELKFKNKLCNLKLGTFFSVLLGIHTMLCPCLEASLPVLLPNGIEKERHQETYLGGDTAIRQRWRDVCHHTNAEDKRHCA